MPGLHVVLGATGGAGAAVVRALVARGERVRAVSRTGGAAAGVQPSSVEAVAADVSNPADAIRACAGATVVYHCVNPPYTDWPRMIPPLTRAVLEGAAAAQATLVVADNLYMYGPVQGAMTESTPAAATGKKGRLRAEAAKVFLDAHESGRVRTVIARASDFYGPGVTNALLGDRAFMPLLEGKTLFLLGDLDVPHTYTYIDDFACALVTLGEREEALGRVWHTPNAETLTTREIVLRAAKIAGTSPSVKSAGRWLVNVAGVFSPLFRELRETIYQFEAPFVVDHAAYARAFGEQVTPHDEALSRTLDWFRARK